jgi:hypothetical protein
MQYETKKNLKLSTFMTSFGALDSVECLLTEDIGNCYQKYLSDDLAYMYKLIQNLIHIGYESNENLFAAAYDWRFDPENSKFIIQ